VEQNRIGDHICYISNLAKFKSHYPNWRITISLDEIIRQIIAQESLRLQNTGAR
jgi:CDP-paratose 2-epimerase